MSGGAFNYSFSAGPWGDCRDCKTQYRDISCLNETAPLFEPFPSIPVAFCENAGLSAPSGSQACICPRDALTATERSLIIVFSIFGSFLIVYLVYHGWRRLRPKRDGTASERARREEADRVKKIKHKEKKKKKNKKYEMNDAAPDIETGLTKSMQPRHQPRGSVGPQRRALDLEFAHPDLEMGGGEEEENPQNPQMPITPNAAGSFNNFQQDEKANNRGSVTAPANRPSLLLMPNRPQGRSSLVHVAVRNPANSDVEIPMYLSSPKASGGPPPPISEAPERFLNSNDSREMLANLIYNGQVRVTGVLPTSSGSATPVPEDSNEPAGSPKNAWNKAKKKKKKKEKS